MSSEQPDKPFKPERDRIGELEEQVKELSGLLEILLEKEDGDAKADDSIVELVPEPRKHHLVEDVTDAAGRALGGVEGESLESRIGGIWLGRIVAMLFLTLFVLGGMVTLQEDALQALEKIGIGYATSLFAIGYGLWKRKSDSFFPQTILGSGLAAFYFTTYASLYLESTQIYTTSNLGIPVLAGVLLGIAGVAHWYRSQTVAGITLFLIYYTIILSLSQGATSENVSYAFLTGAMLAVVALVFHLTHRWLLFTWGALVATQITYIYFFYLNRPQLDITDVEYFWYSTGFLTLVFCVFSAAAITDGRRTGEFRRTVGPMAGVNSFVYLALTWVAIRLNFPEFEWAFRLGQTALFLTFTGYAYFAARNRNYLFQIFAAKSFIIFTLALQAYLSHEWLLVAMAIECLALGFSYMRSGLVIFKVLGLGLLLATFAATLFTVKTPDQIEMFDYSVPARWFTCIGVPFVFCIVAWFYEHFVRRLSPEQRTVKGQWFLADSRINLSGAATALMHSAAATLILMAITILELGDEPTLPFILAGEGMLMAILGLLLATPQVEIASVLLLIAAHVCYHLFLMLDKPGFEVQENYILYTSIVAGVTFLGGYLWERYLDRIEGGGQWEHDSMVAIPYLAGTMMLSSLMERNLDPMYAPIAQLLLAAGLFMAAAATLLVGLRVAGVLAVALGTASFYTSIYTFQAPITQHPDFLMGLFVALIAYAASERASAIWEQRTARETRSASVLRSVIVALAAAMGLLGLLEWAPQEYVSFFWLAHFMGALILGLVFRESRYRWAAITIYLIAIGRAFIFDLQNLSPALRFMSFAALTMPGLLLQWGYSEYRARHLRKLQQEHDEAHAPDASLEDASIPDA